MAFQSPTTTSVLDYPGYYEGTDFSQRNENEFLEYSFVHLKRYEGLVHNLYADTKRKVTIGIGHLVPNENANSELIYNFRVPPDPPRTVTAQDKKDEWKRMNEFASKMKDIPAGTSEVFRKETLLDMSETDAKNLFFKDINIRLKELKNILPNYNKYPDPAKLGILDVYFNVGGGAKFDAFVKFKTAIVKQDWMMAKTESRRKNEKGAKGITERNEAVFKLFEEAHEIQKAKNVPANAIEKVMQKEETRNILQAETDFDDIII